MKTRTAETLLDETLARASDSIAACLSNADAAAGGGTPFFRDSEMDRAVALLHASARLADALARLRGNTQHIRVSREGPPSRRGSNRRGADSAPAVREK